MACFVGVCYLPMTKWTNEVEAAVGSVVRYITTIKAALISQKLLEFIINVLYDWLVAAGRVN